MPLYIGQRAAEPTDVYVGTREVNQIFQGNNLVWSHGSLPAITDFAVAPPYLLSGVGGRTIQLAFIVTGSNHNTITALSNGANVPLTSNTGVTGLAAPADDETYRLRCYLAATATGRYSHRDVHFYRLTAPSITANFGTTQAPGSGVVPRIQVSVTMHPWLQPHLTLDPEIYGFRQANFQRLASRSGDPTRTITLQGDPRLATQPTVSGNITLTAGIRINGVRPSVTPDATTIVTVRY